jgi:integrase
VFRTLSIPKEVPTVWVVERLDIDGEELPVIRHVNTWLPAPVALRYALRTRFRIGPVALTNDLRAITILYNWAEATEGVGNFECFLTSGHILNKDQLLTFIPYLQMRRYKTGELSDVPPDFVSRPPLVCDQTFNVRISAIQQFLKWAVEPANHGGYASFDEDKRDELTRKMIDILDQERLPVGDSPRQEPITVKEVELIRKAIAPDGAGTFPPNVFSASTRYRNWIMFETALHLGARRGELLTLKVTHLPFNGDGKFFLIPRQQDAPEDPRKRRRLRGKTKERKVPLMDPALLPSILGYRDAAPPIGRNDPKIVTPYLFVTNEGDPISNSSAGYIIKRIGKYTACLLAKDPTLDKQMRARFEESLLALTWHRLRHTWAEWAALSLYERYKEGAWPILKQWGDGILWSLCGAILNMLGR